jgi:23S rRNA (cytosine1962-C5)-methyltransferase
VLEALPPVNDARLAVRVTSDALRQIRGGHPWVYDASITSLNHRGAPGDLAIVFDQKRKFAAIGLYDPDGPIALRIIHVGKRRPIDDHFWAEKVADAAQLRRPLMDVEPGGRPAYRLINGENDALPGFVVDRYADTLVAQYSPVWFPHLRHLVESLIDETGAAAVVLRLARNVAAGDTFGLADGDVIAGVLAQNPVAFTEGGLSFEADVRAGQKTGHFLDHGPTACGWASWRRDATCSTCLRPPAGSPCTPPPEAPPACTASTCRRPPWRRRRGTWPSTPTSPLWPPVPLPPRSGTRSR